MFRTAGDERKASGAATAEAIAAPDHFTSAQGALIPALSHSALTSAVQTSV
jgi:hypothetical protein